MPVGRSVRKSLTRCVSISRRDGVLYEEACERRLSMECTPESPVSPAPAVRHHWGSTLLWVAPVLVLGLALLYGVLTRPAAVPDDTTPRVGQPLADFVVPDLAGRPVQLAALRGKVVFINVWATWCPPCIEEMPTIQRLYERLHDRGVEVLAISIDALGAQ